MVAQHTGRYSKYIRPISILFDLIAITVLSMYFFRDLKLNPLYYLAYQTVSWILIAVIVRYYEIFRFTTPVEIISKLMKQFSVFLLVVIAFFPFAKTAIFSGTSVAIFMCVSFSVIIAFKYFLFIYLNAYYFFIGAFFGGAG